MMSSMRKTFQRLLCFAVIMLPVASTADNDALTLAAAEETTQEGLSAGDRRFLEEVAASSIEEAQLGKLAAQKAPSASVRVFAQRSVNDHAQLNEQLQSIAQAKGVALPTSLDTRRQKTIETLEKLDAAAFERAYLKLMTEDHQKDIKAFRKQVQGSQDSDVKSFVTSNLPKLHDHLALVREAARTAQTTAVPNRATASAARRDTTSSAIGNATTR